MRKRYLELLVISVGVVLITVCLTPVVYGFTITSPAPGAIFHPGDSVTIKVQFDPNETPATIFLYAVKMKYAAELLNGEPYEFTFSVTPTFTGKDTLVAGVHYADGTAAKKEVEVSVVLPTSVLLTGISVDPAPILLKKLPEGSDPNDIRISETEYISVGGKYSDGVKRNISAAADGTTYASSDERVVTVDSEGNLKAQGIGNATITIRNGKFSATVKVTVDPYEKWN